VHLGASLPIEKNGINPFSQTRKACTIVRLTFPPPPALPSASLLLRRQQAGPQERFVVRGTYELPPSSLLTVWSLRTTLVARRSLPRTSRSFTEKGVLNRPIQVVCQALRNSIACCRNTLACWYWAA